MRKKLLLINSSPRKDGVSAEIEKQLKAYFTECDIECENTYKLAPNPCIACGYCERNDGCAQKDLDDFFVKFEDADYIIFLTPVYNNFFPSPLKALIDRFQRYYSARFVKGIKPPIEKPKKVGLVICSGAKNVPVADYMTNAIKQCFTVLNGELVARYYIPSTDLAKYTFNIIELEKFVHQIKK